MASTTPKLMPLARLARGAFSSSITSTKQSTGTHLHRLLGFSQIVRVIPTGDFIFSAPFVVGDRKWRLKIYPNGVDAEHRGFISADVYLDSWYATASYRVSILDNARDPVHSRVAGPFRFRKEYINTEIKDLIAKEELERSAPFLLKDDCLDVRCDVAVVDTETKQRKKWFMGFGSNGPF